MKIKDMYKELSKLDLSYMTPEHKTLLENFKNNGDPVPRWAFEIVLNEGMFNNMSKEAIFTETLIEDIYHNKTHPSFYMYWLGRGMFYMGKNPRGLNTPKLEGEFIGKWRHGTNSVDTKFGREHDLVTTSMRFTPSAHNITSKSKVDIITKEGRDALSKDINNPASVMASRAIENHKKVVTASRSIENVRKFVKTEKKKGMSTLTLMIH